MAHVEELRHAVRLSKAIGGILTQTPGRSFAEELQILFDAVRHPSGREYNVSEIAEAINARGYRISRGYISALKLGTKGKPSWECIQAIATFFDVPVAYFFDEDVQRWIDHELRAVAALRNSPVRQITVQAFGLSDGSLQVVVQLINHLRTLEGLPESSGAPAPKRRRRWGSRTRDSTST